MFIRSREEKNQSVHVSVSNSSEYEARNSEIKRLKCRHTSGFLDLFNIEKSYRCACSGKCVGGEVAEKWRENLPNCPVSVHACWKK